jgi:uncharacterized cupin superfamily protein
MTVHPGSGRWAHAIRGGEEGLKQVDLDEVEVLEGEPKMLLNVVWRNDANTVTAGFSRTLPGRFAFEASVDEFLVVTAGRVVVTPDDEKSVECVAGDFLQVRAGRRYEFDYLDVTEDYFVSVSPTPLEY